MKNTFLLSSLPLFAGMSLSAAVVFQTDFETDQSGLFTVSQDAAADSSADFNFDYSALGIPAAPGGGGTTGVRLASNLAGGAASYIATSPTGVTMSGSYSVGFDMWLNYNTSGGTTEYGGGVIGFDPSNVLSGAAFLGNTDGDTGGTGSDYRYYQDGVRTEDKGKTAFSGVFVGGTTPASQGDPALFDPTNVIVTAADGTLGFRWAEVMINVDPDSVDFSIDGNSIFNINGVNTSGGVALMHADIFSSVAGKPEFAFGVFDNLVITQIPEPSTSILALVGAIGFMARRRR